MEGGGEEESLKALLEFEEIRLTTEREGEAVPEEGANRGKRSLLK